MTGADPGSMGRKLWVIVWGLADRPGRYHCLGPWPQEGWDLTNPREETIMSVPPGLDLGEVTSCAVRAAPFRKHLVSGI